MSAPSGGGRNPREIVAAAVERARESGHRQWVAQRTSFPARAVRDALGGADHAERFYWERPLDDRLCVGLGAAASIETRGASRFADAAAAARDLFTRVHVIGDDAPAGAGPLLVGGFGFADEPGDDDDWADFPPGHLVLPEVLLTGIDGEAWCTCVREVDGSSDVGSVLHTLGRDHDAVRHLGASVTAAANRSGSEAHFETDSEHSHAAYCERVASALAAIAVGDLEKVVVARSLRVRHDAGFEAGALLAALRDSYPSCTHFSVTRPGGTFLGATPERLVRRSGDRVETAAVAGTARRSARPEEDQRLGRELVESKKEQAEHAVVVRALREALEGCCSTVETGEAPRLLRVDGIQHLETRVEGVLARPLSVLEIAGRLHPAPSVAGSPRETSLAWLAREEGLDRGWYAGAVGYVDATGDGDFCVALRSARLHDGEATLYAGAGIVAGSDPEAELRETRLKFRALLTPLLDV